jgi:hypothetical protein
MRSRYSLFLVLMLLPFISCREEIVTNPQFEGYFIKFFGDRFGQDGYECRQLPDGNYVLVGTVNKTNQLDGTSSIRIIRTDPKGNELNFFDLDSMSSRVFSMDLTANGQVIVAGDRLNGSQREGLVAKINPAGGTIWKTIINSRIGGGATFQYSIRRVRVSNDGSILVTGSSNDLNLLSDTINVSSTNSSDFFFARLTASGQVDAYFSKGFRGTDVGHAIVQILPNNLFALIGSSENKPAEVNGAITTINDMILLGGAVSNNLLDNQFAYSKSGDPITLPGSVPGLSIKDAADAISKSNNEVEIVGNTNDGNIYFIRVQFVNPTSAQQLISRNLELPGFSQVFSMSPTSDGGFILAGSHGTSATAQQDILLVKTNSNGAVQWYRTFGGARNDRSYYATQTTDGGYLISGTYGVENIPMICLIKTNPEGELK